MSPAIAGLAVLLALPAVAQEPVAAVEMLQACLAAAERDPEAERACVGVQALACIDADPTASTSAGMRDCYAAEAAAWEEVQDATVGDIAAMSRVALAEGAVTPEALLEAAQTAWAAFRDADCAQAAAHWADDPMRDVAGAQCRLERGAGRTLELMARRRIYEDP